MGSKTRTLWNTNGRAPDSRDLFDYTGQGLRVGRMDIPASLVVEIEGYSKVEYRATMGDGSVQVFPNFKGVIDYMTGSIESKAGSNVMTVFLNETDPSQLGYYQVDVYKEWEMEDPEQEPGTGMEVRGLTKYFTTMIDDDFYLFKWLEVTEEGKEPLGRSLPHEMWGVALINSLKHMRPQTFKALQEALGITPSTPTEPEA